MQFTPGLESTALRREWWNSLGSIWQQVFEEAVFQRNPGDTIASDDDLLALCGTTVLRIVGPGGMNPSFNGSLINLEGLRRLTQIEYLFVMHCQLESLDGIESLVNLKSLFVQNNNLTEISQIRKMAALGELYISNNFIESIEPVKDMKALHTLHCENNTLTTLEGIKAYHEKTLKILKCQPNDQLPQREVIRVQNTYGILCR